MRRKNKLRKFVILFQIVSLLLLSGLTSAGERASCPWKLSREISLVRDDAVTGRIIASDCSENAAMTITLDYNGNVKLYRTYPLKLIYKLGKFNGGKLVAISRSGNYAAVMYEKGLVAITLNTAEPQTLGPASFEYKFVKAIDITDSGVAVIASAVQTMLYSFQDGKARTVFKHTNAVSCRIRGEHCVIGLSNGRILVVSTVTGDKRDDISVGVKPIVGVDITADGKTACGAVERDSIIVVISVGSGKIKHTFTTEGIDFFPGKPFIKDCAISADGIFVAASYNGKFLLFDTIFKKVTGIVSTKDNEQGGIRLVGDKPTLFCRRTLSFRDNKGDEYNALPSEPTLSLLAIAKDARGTQEILFAPSGDIFYLFLLNGKLSRMLYSAKKPKELGQLPASGKAFISPKGKKIVIALEIAAWISSSSKPSRSKKVALPDGWDNIAFCGETRFFVQKGTGVVFWDTRGDHLTDAKIGFVPDFVQGIQGGALFANRSGNWAAITLPAGSVERGKLEVAGGKVVGLSNGGILLLNAIEGSYYRPGTEGPLFRIPLAREVTRYCVTQDASWIAYCTPTGTYVREIATGKRWQLPGVSDYPALAFSPNRRRLYFYSTEGIAVFSR